MDSRLFRHLVYRECLYLWSMPQILENQGRRFCVKQRPHDLGLGLFQRFAGLLKVKRNHLQASQAAFLGMGSHNHGGLPPCSPLQARHPGKQQSLDIPSSFARAVESTPTKVVAVHATPSRQGKLNIIEADASANTLNIIIEGVGIEGIENTSKSCFQRDRNDDSIYKSLGWDDYDEFA